MTEQDIQDIKVCVIGMGYIGLPTAALLAIKGFMVHGVDVRADVVDTINQGEIHIYEPELDILVKSAVHSTRLTAGTRPEPADVFIVAVPTPFTDGSAPDTSFVKAATEAIAAHMRPGNLVVLESTSPVGTTEKMAQWIAEHRPDLRVPRRGDPASTGQTKETDRKGVYIAHCPERVLPGNILKELVENDRIVGGIDKASSSAAAGFYRRFVSGRILETESRTAELAKLAENSYRDVNIAFANELSIIADGLDIDVWDLIELANQHPRVNILQPGPGVGGHCIAVDPWFIIDAAGDDARLMRAARAVNDAKPEFVIEKVRAHAARFKQPTIACFGLAFKADIDDLRGSPAVDIVRQLASEQIGEILAVEPHISEVPESLQELGVALVDTDHALQAADIVLGLVNHKVLTDLDRLLLQDKIVIDTRGMWR